MSCCIILFKLCEVSDRLDVVDAALVVEDVEDDVDCWLVPSAPPELVGPPKGGGGGPSKLLSPIDERMDDDVEAPDVELSADSSCFIMSSRLLDRSARLDVVDVELVVRVEAPALPEPLTPPMPPPSGGGGGGPSPPWACSKPDMVLDDKPFRK